MFLVVTNYFEVHLEHFLLNCYQGQFRLNLFYFVLQGHSVRCTESFARENVLEEMKDMTVSSESKQRMLEALKRIHFDEEGRSIFEDEELRDSNEDEEDDEDTSGSG
jgi:hypothetical protein